MSRRAKIIRKTTETDIQLEIDLDKTAGSKVDTTIPFFNHMLELFARHGFFKLVVKSKGDTQIDDHHLIEDLGICLGKAVGQALGKKRALIVTVRLPCRWMNVYAGWTWIFPAVPT